MVRPSWDEYFRKITREVAQRSTCLRRQIGSVLVVDKHILTTGYNGVPRGLKHCEAVGCLRIAKNVPSGERHELCRGLHAEMNALLQAAKYGIQISGATIYTTTYPCSLCAKMIINSDIKRVVAEDGYPDELAKEMFAEAKVKVDVINKSKKEPAKVKTKKAKEKE